MSRTDGIRLIMETRPFVEKVCGQQTAAAVIEAAGINYRQLVAQNENEPKAMYPHTRNRIYPGIALFQALTASGVSRETAADLFRQFYRQRAEKPAAAIRNLLKFPGLYKLMPRVFKAVMQKSFGENAGFKAMYYNTPRNEFRADMIACPYCDICRKYNCPELVAAFCETDDVAYGNMHPRIIWGRTKTMGKGGDCCNFKLTIQ